MDVGGAPSRGEGVPDTQGSVVQKTLPPPTCPGPSRGGEPRAQAVFATSQALLCAAASTEEPRAGQGSAHLGSEGEVSGISRSPPLDSRAPTTVSGFGGGAAVCCLLQITGAPLILPQDSGIIPAGKRQPRGKEARAGPHEVSRGCPTPTRA